MPNYATQYATPRGSGTVAEVNPLATAAYPTDQLQALIQRRLQRQVEAERAAKRQQVALRYPPAQQASALEGPTRPMWSSAPAQLRGASDPGIPNYVKMMTSPGVVPGYARASAGDPGAVFAGYVPRDNMNPSAAHFVSAPGFAPTPGPDLYSPEARNRVAYSAYR